ncbi:sensor histidine kinase [Acuticoccus sp.]|uniref:sensor histidine kinase n=1 Tax=Acuticoccus sp. TaxID=1904378 RepID=UPI003B52A02E
MRSVEDRAAAPSVPLAADDAVGTPFAREYDELTKLAAGVCDAPMALVSLIDADRQWCKSGYGLSRRKTALDEWVCAHAIASAAIGEAAGLEGAAEGAGLGVASVIASDAPSSAAAAVDLVEIPDTRLDPRSRDNPLVTGEPGIMFYAGAVLRSPDGVAFGTLCVLDTKPRTLTVLQRDLLAILARQAVKELELRVAMRRQEILHREVDHRVKNSLQAVASFVRLQATRAEAEPTREALEAVGRRVSSVALLHQELYSVGVEHEIPLDRYMAKVGALFAASAPEGVHVVVAFDPVAVTSEQATALAAIANEFVTNAFKHAFPDGRAGEVTLHGVMDPDGSVRVTMADDGVGFAHLAPPERRGIGLRIVEASAVQMGATLEMRGDGPGTQLTLTFQARRPAVPTPLGLPSARAAR